MKIVLLTPGTGSYHCGVCMRDNALAKELHRQGHDALMLPMYLPLTLDEDAASPDTPIFFGGVSTYLREKVPWLRHMPRWIDRLLSHRAVVGVGELGQELGLLRTHGDARHLEVECRRLTRIQRSAVSGDPQERLLRNFGRTDSLSLLDRAKRSARFRKGVNQAAVAKRAG